MRLSAPAFAPFGLASFILLAGCTTKSQTAVVVSKEYIPAQVTAPEGAEPPVQNEHATQHDQWLVHVEMADRKKAQADVEQAQWNELRIGDKVTATYAQGNYTGTVWRVELRKPAPAATP